MSNANAPAMPVMDEHPEHGQHYGLTKREQFAMAAMQARASIPGGFDANHDCEVAVLYADALLEELEK